VRRRRHYALPSVAAAQGGQTKAWKIEVLLGLGDNREDGDCARGWGGAVKRRDRGGRSKENRPSDVDGVRREFEKK